MVNRTIILVRAEVAESRKNGNFNEHLAKGTRTDPQALEATCPSGNRWGIQCTCVDSGVSARLDPSYGPTLFLSPASLIDNWLRQATMHLDLEDSRFHWIKRAAYGDPKLKEYAPKLEPKDLDLVKRGETAPYFDAGRDRSNVLCFSTAGSMPGQIDRIMSTYIPTVPKRGKVAAQAAYYRPGTIGWGRIVVDEVHTEHNKNSGTIAKIRKIDESMKGGKPRKTLLTGTPFDSSPKQMAGWVSLLEDETWTTSKDVEGCPRWTRQRYRLRWCTESALIDLGKVHETLVKTVVTGAEIDATTERNHRKALTVAVRTLWVRRTPDSLFGGYDLVQLPPNYHFDCLLSYPPEYRKVLDEYSRSVQQEVTGKYRNAVVRYKAGQSVLPPTVSVHSWLAAARMARIVSSFPQLAILDATKDLALTGEELNKHGWLKKRSGCLYEFLQTGSPYEKYIKTIAGASTCPKMRALLLGRRCIWGREKKIVIMAMSPVSAFIIYWVSTSHEIRPHVQRQGPRDGYAANDGVGDTPNMEETCRSDYRHDEKIISRRDRQALPGRQGRPTKYIRRCGTPIPGRVYFTSERRHHAHQCQIPCPL